MNEDPQKFYVPRGLNEPTRIAVFTIDEFIALMVPVSIGQLVFHQMLIGILVGAVLLTSLYKFKVGRPKGSIRGLLYWHLPALEKRQFIPPSQRRFYLG